MNLTNETLGVLWADTASMLATCVTTLQMHRLLAPEHAGLIAESLKTQAGILEAYAGEALPVGLAPALFAQALSLEAYRNESRSKP